LETKDNAAEEEIESLNATIAKLKKKAKRYDKLQDDTQTVYTNYVDELTALREVNEILRNDVARWEKMATAAEEKAAELKNHSDMELKSFTNALERMEELRTDTEQELVDARI
jgi:predicted RNase H-like nuclease (RuvC/YqgF family)